MAHGFERPVCATEYCQYFRTVTEEFTEIPYEDEQRRTAYLEVKQACEDNHQVDGCPLEQAIGKVGIKNLAIKVKVV